ncbi:MAG: hypothetical protein IT337_11070 [Thermomicrobiales bacterium]|nr:hypothetical protein [Thermomicrobiales bacterium]
MIRIHIDDGAETVRIEAPLIQGRKRTRTNRYGVRLYTRGNVYSMELRAVSRDRDLIGVAGLILDAIERERNGGAVC